MTEKCHKSQKILFTPGGGGGMLTVQQNTTDFVAVVG